MSRLRSATPALLTIALLVAPGCGEPSLDSPEYGEIIPEVPAHLDQPYPLPELEPPSTAPEPAPQSPEETQPVAEGTDK